MTDRAVRRAKELVDLFSITKPNQLRIESIAEDRGALVVEKPLQGLEGMLYTAAGIGIIAYRQGIPEEGRRRFTIAHELGHWELHRGRSQAYLCTTGDVHGYRGSPMELEANAFAAELLMPSAVMGPMTKYSSVSIKEVVRLAQAFGTTLTATAVRLVEHVNEPCIVAFLENDRVSWCRKSKKAEEYFLPHGYTPACDSNAALCTTDIEETQGMEVVDAEAWFPEDRQVSRMTVREEAVLLGNYGTVMCLLSIHQD